MRIIYFGSIAGTDSDFPLLREFQKQGADVIAYYVLVSWNLKYGLINAESIEKRDFICKASEIDAFKPYSEYIDLEKIYIINSYHHKRSQWQNWLLWIKVLRHIYRQTPSVIHFVWPPVKQEKWLYLLPLKRVLTIHDPFPHSSNMSKVIERNRTFAFSKCDKIVLLNDTMMQQFIGTYKIDRSKILLNRMGEFDYLRNVRTIKNKSSKNVILFFGQIQSHKGIDILLESMIIVHRQFPDVKLVIAGKGEFYFDVKPYKELGYIEFINRYVTIPELSQLLCESLFVVCPYKDATQSGVVQTAFSANVPLIVTNVGALPDSVKDGVYGLVVPPCNVTALSDAMKKLLDNPELVANFRKNIEEEWRPSMSWEPIAEKYINLYNELSKEK